MALVCNIMLPLDLRGATYGKFGRNKEHLLATPRGACVDFYRMLPGLPEKYTTVDFSDNLSGGSIHSIKTMQSRDEKDFLVLTISYNIESETSFVPMHVLVWNGQNCRSIGNFQNPKIFTSPASCIAVASGKRCEVFNFQENRNSPRIYSGSLCSIIETIHFLSDKQILVGTRNRGYICSQDDGLSVHSEFVIQGTITGVIYNGSNSYDYRSTNVITTTAGYYNRFSGGAISGLKKYTDNNPPISAPLTNLSGTYFLSQNGVYQYSDENFRIVTALTPKPYFTLQGYVSLLEEDATGLTLYLYSETGQLVCRFTSSNASRVMGMHRALAGSHYGIEDHQGNTRILRNSLILQEVDVLSNGSNEPVENIFKVGHNKYLLCQKDKVSCVDSQKAEVKSWYTNISTIYADATFQVAATGVYANGTSRANPLNSNITMACAFRDMLVVACSNQVALLSPELNLERITNEKTILNLTIDGYATPTGRKYFDGGILKAPKRCQCTQIYGDLGLTFFSDKFDVVHAYSESTGRYERTDITSIDDSYDSGAGTVIVQGRDSYLIRRTNLISLKNCGSKCLFSSDLNTCVSLVNGTVRIMDNMGIGFDQVKKYTHLAEQEVLCASSDGLYIWYHSEEDSTCTTVDYYSSRNNEFAKYKPKKNNGFFYSYLITPNNYLVEFAYSLETESPSTVMTTYSLATGSLKLLCQLEIEPSLEEFTYSAFRSQVQARQYESIIIYSEPGTCTSCECHIPNSRVVVYEVTNKGLIVEKSAKTLTKLLRCSSKKRLFDYEIGYESQEYGGGSELVDFISQAEPVLVEPYELLENIKVEDFMNSEYSYALLESNDGEYFIGYTNTSKKSSPFRLRKITKDGFIINDEGFPLNYTSFNSFENLKVFKVSKFGSPTKYYPDFLVYGPSSMYTVTILPKNEASKLAEIQDILYPDYKYSPGVPEIDGCKLLQALETGKFDRTFRNRGINPLILQRDLVELLK